MQVKAAVFSTLSHLRSIRGASFLDLFCGVGSVGIEALSRGAAAATFVDASPHCVEVRAQENDCWYNIRKFVVFIKLLRWTTRPLA